MSFSNKYTDEELLAYLLNDGEQEKRSALARDLGIYPELADRLASLKKIWNRLQRLPLEAFYARRRTFSPLSLIIKSAILTGIFFIGALAQSEFSILNQHHNTPAVIRSTSSGGDFPFSSRVVM